MIFDNEYGSNYITLVNNNLNVRVSKLMENGEISFEDLKRKVKKYKPKAVWVVHIGGHIAFQINEIANYRTLIRNII